MIKSVPLASTLRRGIEKGEIRQRKKEIGPPISIHKYFSKSNTFSFIMTSTVLLVCSLTSSFISDDFRLDRESKGFQHTHVPKLNHWLPKLLGSRHIA